MSARENPVERRWTIDAVESLLRSLTGVAAVRLVAKPGSDIEEIHLLTTQEVTPKQTVRNVESALLAHFDLEIDHRKISVAQSRDAQEVPARTPAAGARAPEPRDPVVRPITSSPESRILFLGHRIETQRSQQVRMVVSVEWQGQTFEGEANGPDVARGRLDATAQATLAAVEAVAAPGNGNGGPFSLTLDGLKIMEAFDRSYVLVAVHAVSGRHVTHLAGSALVDDTPDKAVIMATLQATDRWVRGRK
ncbi:MAG: hypothetical protein RQ751_12420 [Longimicrobiales bacterium]|nr:hypothetical protein [Longimicrobiales bacterium]